jgi:hypothetical protein
VKLRLNLYGLQLVLGVQQFVMRAEQPNCRHGTDLDAND